MRPTLFELHLPWVGELSFPTYMTMLVVGFLAGVWSLRRWGDRDGLPGHQLVDLGFVMLLAGLLGARLLAVLTDGQLQAFIHLCTDPALVPAPDALVRTCTADADCGARYLCDPARKVCHPPRDCLAALKFWQPGLTFYGGVLAALPVGWWFARRKKLDPLQVADLAAPALMFGQFFGRLGCFFQGCCYGAATDAWVGVSFPGHAHARHPTQIYESLTVLGLFFILRYLITPRKRGHGEVLGWLFVLYGVARSILELLRDDPRGALGPLSTSQLISIPLIALGVYLIVTRRRRASIR
jgi:phosphatidylglycerol---prolipoprotein diacylglyceryl transferase